MSDPEYTLPVIHFNGSGQKSLHDQYETAWKAATELANAFVAIDFHPRDYYPKGPQAFERARLERGEIREAVWTILQYLTQHERHLAWHDTDPNSIQESSSRHSSP